MRRIAIINQKGGVGKTTTTSNLGAALALQGRRVVVVDMDAQANLTLALGIEPDPAKHSSYSVLVGAARFGEALVDASIPGLRLLPANIDLSGAELELASAMGREFVLRDALVEWNEAEKARTGRDAADYVLFDCPPSLGLLAINSLSAAGEVLITLQTEFLALQGMSKLVEVVQLLKKRLNPQLQVAGILPCMYDSRKRLAREVLGEIRSYFKGDVLPVSIRSNVKLAEAPSYGKTIFSYAPDSSGAQDYMDVARFLLEGEARFSDMRGLPAFDAQAKAPLDAEELARREAAKARRPPPPRRPAAQASTTSKAAAKPPTKGVLKPAPKPAASVVAEAPLAVPAPVAQAGSATGAATPRPSPQAATQAVAATASPTSAQLSSTLDMPELPPDAFAILSSLPDGP